MSNPPHRGGPLGPLVAVLVVLVLAVASCASIPRTGPVLEGAGGQRDTTDVRVVPPVPARGASPREIVRDFLVAAGDAHSGYSAAREFLTPRLRSAWQPDAGTIVYGRQGPEETVIADGRAVPTSDAVAPGVDRVRVRLRVTEVATIDSHGRYATAPAGTSRQVDLVVVLVDGEWRIGEMADGVLVSESYLRLAYRSFKLYFLDPSSTMLVPEVRWLPNRESNATVLTRELLAGPSEWLADAVDTGFPAGTTLAPPASVRIEDGVAIVDLSTQVLHTTLAERALMLAQLETTLEPVEDVTTVSIRVEGDRVRVPAPADLVVDPAVDGWPVLVQGDRLVRLRPGGTLDPVQGLPDLPGRAISDPALSPLMTPRPLPLRCAVLAAHRTQLLVLPAGRAGGTQPPALVGTDLTAPSFDPFGWVWSTSASSTGTVTAVSPSGDVAHVLAPWLGGRRVSSLRISREGTRALVASTDSAGRGHVDVAGVVRGDDLVPRALSPGGPLPLGVDLVSADAAAWLGEVDVAVLGRSASDEQARVYPLRLGGLAEDAPLPAVPDARDLAVGDILPSVLVTTASGEVLRPAGSAWVEVRGLQGARDPVFPG